MRQIHGRLLGIAVLLIWGVARLPMETAMTRERDAHQFSGFKQTMGLREQVGQAGMIAALGGLRSAVADLLWIRAHIAWTNVEWGRMKYLFDAVTILQPRRATFWDMSAWHMAYNASVSVSEDPELPPEERRLKRDQYFRLGEDYLLRGIEANPDSWELYSSLGTIYRDKFRDAYRSHLAYAEAAKRPDHLDYVERFSAYMLAEVPGKEQEAYAQLLAFYNKGKQEWLPTLLKKIQILERKLSVPEDQRVFIPEKHRLDYQPPPKPQPPRSPPPQ